MLENASVQAPAMSRPRRRPRLPIDAQARRVEELRRAFQRMLNRRPTLIEKAAMLRAAALVARAEALALDPNADVTELVKVNNLAGRTLRSLGIRIAPPVSRTAARVAELREARWAEQDRQRAAQAAARREASATNTTEPPDGRAA
jgi:hypothetical protein